MNRAHAILAFTEQEAPARPLLLEHFFRASHLSDQFLINVSLAELVLDLLLVEGARDILLDHRLLSSLTLLLLLSAACNLLVN